MQINDTQEIYGCGKISAELLKAMLRPLHDIKPGASKFEIFTLLYLSQIADQKGYVSELYIKQLPDVIGCSERATYTILYNLHRKSFIKMDTPTDMNWTGIKNIQMQMNNFSGVKSFTGKRQYINTFAKIFDLTDAANFARLSSLSLYALRLLLVLAKTYEPKTGLKISCDRLAEYLHISNRALINNYMQELSVFLCDKELYTITKSGKKNYGMLFIAADHLELKGSNPSEYQETYYKRKWLQYFAKEGYTLDTTYPVYKYMSYIFSMIYSLLKKGSSLNVIEEKFKEALENEGFSLNILSIYRAANEMVAALET